VSLDAARRLAIRATDVSDAPARRVEGATVFASALPSTDILFADDGERFEEVRVMHDAAAPDRATWAIDAGDGIADVRLDRGQVQAFDRNGRIVLRSDRMFAVDRNGVRREPMVTLERAGHGWTLNAKLDRTGLAYPIVLDPVWLPGPSGAMRSNHFAVRLGDGKVYVVGATTKFEVFDPATSSFKTLADCTGCFTVNAAFATSDNKVRIVVGGTVKTYDPTTDTWTVSAATGSTGDGSVYGQLGDGRIFAAGGFSSPSTVEIYSPSTDTWIARTALTEGRQNAMLSVLPSGKVWIAGGFSGTATLSTTELYDSATNAWTSGPALTTPLSDAHVLTFAGGSVALFTGRTATGPNAKVIVYDSTGGTVTDGPTLALGREYSAIALTPDSRIYVIGGSTGPEVATNRVEVSAPLLGAFGATANMLFPRERHTATPLLDGRVLVIGGNGGMLGGSPASTEILSAFNNGVACTWGGECASGFCASGVCCNSACAGDCQRCDLSGSVGQCKAATATIECGAASSCTGSTLNPRGRCSGVDEKCVALAPTACAGALTCADAVSCLTKCSKNEDCATSTCDTATGLCTGAPPADAGPAVAPVPEGAPKVLGSAQRCTSPSECSSGFCVDGVCCDSECKERCHSCALPSSPGRCSEEPLGVDLRAECGPALSCAGTCGKGGVCTTSVEGSQCQPSVCTGPTKGRGAATCKARGVMCNPTEGVEFDCGAYACDAAFGACRTSCTASDACAPGFTCNLTTKSCDRLPVTEDDGGCAITNVGQKRGALAALVCALMMVGAVRRRRS
jgi:hypothetical protein